MWTERDNVQHAATVTKEGVALLLFPVGTSKTGGRLPILFLGSSGGA
jgi:hypothetical protein